MIKKLVVIGLLVWLFVYAYNNGYINKNKITEMTGLAVKTNNIVIINGEKDSVSLPIDNNQQLYKNIKNGIISMKELNDTLKSGVIKTELGETNYKQELKFFSPGFSYKNNRLIFNGINRNNGFSIENVDERNNYDNPAIEFIVTFDKGLKLNGNNIKGNFVNNFKQGYNINLFGVNYNLESMRKEDNKVGILLSYNNKLNKVDNPKAKVAFIDNIEDDKDTLQKNTYTTNIVTKDKLQLTTIGTKLKGNYENNILTIYSINYRVYGPIKSSNDKYIESELILKKGQTLKDHYTIDFYEGTNLLLGNVDLKLDNKNK